MLTEGEIVVVLRAAGCVFAEEEAALLVSEKRADLDELVARRAAGEPLEYVVGWAEFAGIRVLLEAGVFVPRHRTELLVDEAVDLCSPSSLVVDLCCGAGAIGAAMLARLPHLDLYAADVDPAAVRSARRNLPPDRVFEGDLFAALPIALKRRIDVLTVNTPYVPTAVIGMLPPEAREWEHRVALDGGDDGLDIQRRVAASARDWLTPGGSLLVEVSEDQASLSARIFAAAGLAPRVIDTEDATVVVGISPATRGL
jgi:release factor glutamine methyltransferase